MDECTIIIIYYDNCLPWLFCKAVILLYIFAGFHLQLHQTFWTRELVSLVMVCSSREQPGKSPHRQSQMRKIVQRHLCGSCRWGSSFEKHKPRKVFKSKKCNFVQLWQKILLINILNRKSHLHTIWNHSNRYRDIKWTTF